MVPNPDDNTYGRALFQRFADRQTQVIIHTALDQGNNINGFEDIVDKAWRSLAFDLRKIAELIKLTFGVQNGYTGYTPLDQDVDDLNHGRIHRSRSDIMIGPQQNLAQGFPQFLGVTDIDGDKFQDAVLGDDAQQVGPVCLTIIRDQRNPSSSGLEHASTGII